MKRLLFFFPIALSLASCTALVNNNLQEPECLSDADCPTLNQCEGTRACDGMTHTCITTPNTAPMCDDSEPCTADACETATGSCTHMQIDADGDGYSPDACTTPAFADKGDDCLDTNNAVNPGSMEQCGNSIDDNCNGVTDDDAPANITCYQDSDGDGFHNPDVSVAAGCSCPAGYIPPNPMDTDCADGIANAKPGSTYYSSADVADDYFCLQGNKAQPPTALGGGGVACLAGWYPSWDYDCSGASDQAVTSEGTTCGSYSIGTIIGPTIISTFAAAQPKAGFCSARWDSNDSSRSVPGCGQLANQWQCATWSTCNGTVTYNVRQQCH